MSDMTTNPATEVESGSGPAQPPQAEPELEVQEKPEEEQPDDGTLEDVEYDGATYSLPRKLKDALLRHADYTRKTQSLAEERRALEARVREEMAQVRQRQSLAEAHAVVGKLDAQLAQYRSVDWAALKQANPVAAQQHFDAFSALARQRAQLHTLVSGKASHFSQQEKAERTRRAAAAHAALRTTIPDWGGAKQDALYRFASQAFGFRGEELTSVDDPRVIQMLHDAYLYRQSMKDARVQPEQRRAVPVTRVQGTARVTAEPQDSDDEKTWLKKRYAQLTRRR